LGPAIDQTSCVILDIHLGAMSGLELHDRLMAARPTLPVILMTAHDDASSAELSRRTGPHGYLRKPFASEALLTLVLRAVQRRAVREPFVERAIALTA
jgi:FixJ family two-component response regulator